MNLEALLSAALTGGTVPELTPVTPRGPSIGGTPVMGGGDAMAGIGAGLGGGLWDMIGKKDETPAAATGQTQATGWKFDPLNDMPPPPGAGPAPAEPPVEPPVDLDQQHTFNGFTGFQGTDPEGGYPMVAPVDHDIEGPTPVTTRGVRSPHARPGAEPRRRRVE